MYYGEGETIDPRYNWECPLELTKQVVGGNLIIHHLPVLSLLDCAHDNDCGEFAEYSVLLVEPDFSINLTYLCKGCLDRILELADGGIPATRTIVQ